MGEQREPHQKTNLTKTCDSGFYPMFSYILHSPHIKQNYTKFNAILRGYHLEEYYQTCPDVKIRFYMCMYN